jgi:hypothetical protein
MAKTITSTNNKQQMNLTPLETKLLLIIAGEKYVENADANLQSPPTPSVSHPMLGRRCLIRTYSAGVHIGTIQKVNGMEVHLKEAIRLWKWEGGGLSLSAIANNGIVKGRLNRTGEVYLTNAIEIIPITQKADVSYTKFIED